MAKGWYGQKQRHSMSAKGVKSSVIVDEKSGVWFESKGILADVITLMDMTGLGDIFGDDNKKANGMMACGYTEDSYTEDASMVVMMPSSKAEESIEWLMEEYERAETPHRKEQLRRLIKMTLYRITLELKKENPRYVEGQLKESYKMYEGLLNTIDKQRRQYT